MKYQNYQIAVTGESSMFTSSWRNPYEGHHARLVQFVANCKYTTALLEVRRRVRLRQLDAYMKSVRKCEVLVDRCVRCLAPFHLGACNKNDLLEVLS